MNTRYVSVVLLLVGVASLAGCSGYIPSSSDSYPLIDGLHIKNDDDQSHTIDVVLIADGEVIVWEQVALNGTYENERGTMVTDSERLTPVALPTQQNFTVFYRANNGTGGRFAPYSPQHVATYQNCGNDGKNSAYILLMVNQDGTVSPGVACVKKQ